MWSKNSNFKLTVELGESIYTSSSIPSIPSIPRFRTRNENEVCEGSVIAYVQSDKKLFTNLNFLQLYWKLQYASSSECCMQISRVSFYLQLHVCILHYTINIPLQCYCTNSSMFSRSFKNLESHFKLICDLEMFS